MSITVVICTRNRKDSLLQTLANLPEEFASTQLEGIRALLADAGETAAEETSPVASRNRQPLNRQAPHRRRPGR